MIFTLLKSLFLGGAWKQKGGALLIMLVAIVGGMDWKFKDARTAYAMSVLEINLRALDNEDKIYAAVETWKRDEWGAQLGALRVICNTDYAKLDQFGPRDFTITLCRLVK